MFVDLGHQRNFLSTLARHLNLVYLSDWYIANLDPERTNPKV